MNVMNACECRYKVVIVQLSVEGGECADRVSVCVIGSTGEYSVSAIKVN